LILARASNNKFGDIDEFGDIASGSLLLRSRRPRGGAGASGETITGILRESSFWQIKGNESP
jgi:hypothetical protein